MKCLYGRFSRSAEMAMICCLLAPWPAGAFTVDHTNLHLFDQIPSQYITAAQNLRMMWGDRSVGGNINDGLTCLSYERDELAPSHCLGIHSEVGFRSPAGELDWFLPGGLNRSNWTFFFDPGLGVPSEYTCPGYTEGQFDWIGCFIHFVRSNINNYDVFSYQHSYLTIIPGSNIVSPTVGYFVDRPNGSDIYDYERLETDFPSKRILYWTTSLARGIGTQEGVDYNSRMRQFALTRNKILIDVADIESHDPWGNPCYDNRDGVPYFRNGTLREDYPDDGLNIPAICQHYTEEHDGGHLTVGVGKIRLAKAYWIAMAYAAGWRPNGSPPPPPPPATTCDLNSDGAHSVLDVQLCANQAIGVTACGAGDINRDGSCNVVDVQRVVNTALGGPCVTQ